ncbi:hypothetical protein WG66_008779 [Moniliophthora roreri]|nr:hypothetical protein WG66_008779 [Moniliophthora roreri]
MYFDEQLFSRGLDVISRRKEGLFAGKLEQRNCRGMYLISELHKPTAPITRIYLNLSDTKHPWHAIQDLLA